MLHGKEYYEYIQKEFPAAFRVIQEWVHSSYYDMFPTLQSVNPINLKLNFNMCLSWMFDVFVFYDFIPSIQLIDSYTYKIELKTRENKTIIMFGNTYRNFQEAQYWLFLSTLRELNEREMDYFQRILEKGKEPFTNEKEI